MFTKFSNAFVLCDAASPVGQMGVAETIVCTLIFLALLAFGGYFFVLFHRRGYFGRHMASGVASSTDEIRVISIRIMGGKKYLAVVEHLDRRFLLALTHDKVDKISEWDCGAPERDRKISESGRKASELNGKN
jgi:flagellar biogenesis protein FliO